MRRLKLAWFVLLVLTASGNAWGAMQYTLTDLGTLGGPVSYAYAYGINNSGQVAGYSSNGGSGEHGFLYSGGTMPSLRTFGGAGGLSHTVSTTVGKSWDFPVRAARP